MNSRIEEYVHQPQLEQTTQLVFETMTGLCVYSDGSQPLEHPAYTAAVYFAGAWTGAVLLECSAPQAIDWASRLSPDAGAASEADTRDALGELVNMIGGNLKALLPSGTVLSLPSVVAGSDYTVGLCKSDDPLELAFNDPLGVFQVKVMKLSARKRSGDP